MEKTDKVTVFIFSLLLSIATRAGQSKTEHLIVKKRSSIPTIIHQPLTVESSVTG